MATELISHVEFLAICFAFLALGLAVGYIQGRRDAREIEKDPFCLADYSFSGDLNDEFEKEIDYMKIELKRFAE